jgi:hypothetical protein
MNTQTTLPQTPLHRVIGNYEKRICGKWKPNNDFYNAVGINQKRFGLVLRGELPMYYFEAQSLAKFFGVSVDEVVSANAETPNV